ncbi:MAG: N-acetylglucosamine-6-phosphate deacetylase [Clostridia bacterium]|nr:N-acetylglucosamine-6-phosphate deacetylase [Clostridia bacterium]
MKTVIKNGRIIADDEILVGYNLYYENDKISAITKDELPADEVIDAMGNYVSAGFIDMHTHGAGGFDFLDETVEAYLTAAETMARHGTTAVMPTLTSVDAEGMKRSVAVYKEAIAKNDKGAAFIGIHAEGPYFAESQKGAQESRFIHPFIPDEYREILDVADGAIKRWSAAPELSGMEEFADYAKEQGVLLSIGHTDADFDDAMHAYEHGFTHLTHFYSAMSMVHRKNAYRISGVVEAGYLNDGFTVEIIADGKHLPASLLKLIYKVKGADNIALVTDSIRAAGMSDGPSILGKIDNGMEVIVEDGVAKLLDRTAFAGSVATFDRLVRTMITMAEVSLTDAIKMAAKTPARILGLTSKGQLKAGFDADIVVFDESVNIKRTVIGGKTVYTA